MTETDDLTARARELLPEWLGTRLLVREDGRWTDLDSREADGLALGFPLCLVTGWGPRGEERDERENEEANARLEAELMARDLAHRPSAGRGAEGSHEEPGFAIWGIDEQGARELGRRHGQLAVFWITPSEVRVLGALAPVEAVRPRGRTEQ
jgi:hypothetical protein